MNSLLMRPLRTTVSPFAFKFKLLRNSTMNSPAGLSLFFAINDAKARTALIPALAESCSQLASAAFLVLTTNSSLISSPTVKPPPSAWIFSIMPLTSPGKFSVSFLSSLLPFSS